jgi:coenzyme F420 hydrogenase subunit beta
MEKFDLVCETNKELCTRCGMCVGVCPENCFTFDEENYPKLDFSKCAKCGLCEEVCPGQDFDLSFFSRKLFGKPYRLESKLGFFENAYVGYATDQNLRERATAGGVATAILICLLEQKKIDGAIVTVFNKNHPEVSEPLIARTRDELMESIQSKYTVIPLNRVFTNLKKINGQFALVGLPCHIQAFRKLSEAAPSLASKISIVIGLYCGRTMEQKATLSLINMLGVPLKSVKEIQYRGGPWPGEFRLYTKDGLCHSCHKDIFMYLTRLYCPERCMICIDYSSEFSDISVADAWTTEKGAWKYPGGQTIVLERTKAGRETLQLAQKKGYIKLQKIQREEAIRTHKGTSNLRKKGAAIRITGLKKKEKKYPIYGISLPNYSWKDNFEELRRSSGMIIGKFFISRKLIECLAFKLVNELPQAKNRPKVKRLFWHAINLLLKRWFAW